MTGKPTRFSVSRNENGLGFSNGLVPDEGGEFVSYSDYAALQSQLDAARVNVVAEADLSKETVAEYVIQSGDAGLYHLYGSDGVFLSRRSIQQCLDDLPAVKKAMDAALAEQENPS